MKSSIQAKVADSFAQFHPSAASVCRLVNTSSVSIDYSTTGGVSGTLTAGSSVALDVDALTSEVAARRTDLASTPVSVLLEYDPTPDEVYQFATAATDAHATEPAAHLNIVRRTLTGNLVLTAADYQHQRIIPDADRDVTLPAEGASQWAFLLCHSGASYNITVKRAGGTTVGVLIPGSSLAVAWDGTGFGLC